ncbi:DUF4345 family protein [Actinokineospora auranticolor]|uniref:DUF4345 family protein n=1 Tax=Actinokineospora auranticolor TaxID=155976 RepID=UPI0015E2C5AF|nr:DUF4345 family protein [Actinokineospora auranticolor]
MRRVILFLAGVVGVAVGSAVLFVPAVVHESSETGLVETPGVLSEIRAPGAALVVLSAFILSGAFRPHLARAAALLGAALYLSYGLARAFSIVVDGAPASGVLVAMAAELLLGAACAYVVIRVREPVVA